MNTVYLDCSGLPHSIKVDSNLPNTIYIEGQQFINQLNEAIDRLTYPKSKEEKRWDLIVALASNPQIICSDTSNMLEPEIARRNAVDVIKQADAIIKQLEEEKK